MSVYANIPRTSWDITVVNQDEYVFIMTENYEGIFNLDTKKFEVIPDDSPSLPELEVGSKIGDLVLRQETVDKLQDIHGRTRQGLAPAREWDLLELPTPAFDASSEFNMSSNLADWILAEVGHLSKSGSSGRYVERCIADPPKLWKFTVHNEWTNTFISRDKPAIVIYQDRYYIFIQRWDETLEIRRYPRS